MHVRQRIEALRQQMMAAGVDAYLVYSADPHLSEYLPEYWKAREWLSGFTGSMGNLLVTRDRALLWADSRYWVQAQDELSGTGIELMKLGQAQVPSMEDWLKTHLPDEATVAADGLCMSWQQYQLLRQYLPDMHLKIDADLLADIWQDRPSLPRQAVYKHDVAYAVQTASDKLAAVRQLMSEKGASLHLISSLDDIAYLLNLRGSDVDYNPVFLSHLLIRQEDAVLYIDEQKLDASVKQFLVDHRIICRDYAKLISDLGEIAQSETVLIDPQRLAALVVMNLPNNRIEFINPSQLHKSIKTDTQLAHIRRAMEKDGAALSRFFAKFEQAMRDGIRYDEADIHDLISAERAKEAGFISPSFHTIAGFNANGALPHYHAHKGKSALIDGDGLLLIDSGGQYLDGTTDITRVIPVGQIRDEYRRDFTLVLKGMINLSLVVFPEGLPAPLLDTLARTPLWAHRLDYGHGTGHGVGYFLNVHEGPQSISPALHRAHVAMKTGMVTSNEPGLYREGQWGIRIENLVATREAGQSEFGAYCHFETLTLCPVDTRLVQRDLLTQAELDWLNAYHAEVKARLLPYLEGDDLATQWLIERTQPL